MSPREIDALVAEHVYGWHRYDDPNGEFLPHQGWDAPEAKCGVLPEFSTDPAASDQLLSKMRADDWNIKMETYGKGWNVDFYCNYGPCQKHGNPHNNFHSVDAWAESRQMAVALAALAAVGKPVTA